MKKTAAIVTGCVTLALIWALRPGNPSDIATTPQDVASPEFTHVSSPSQPRSGGSRSPSEATQLLSDGFASVSEGSERQIEDQPAGDAANEAETFWSFASEPSVLPDTQESGVTLAQFDRPYATTMTEAGFAQLSSADKSAAIDEIVDSLREARRDALDTCAQADADIACGDYDRAETALASAFDRLGEFTANPQGLYLTRIMAISYQQTALEKLETIYTRTGNHSRRQATRQQWQNLDGQKHQMQAAQMEQAI